MTTLGDEIYVRTSGLSPDKHFRECSENDLGSVKYIRADLAHQNSPCPNGSSASPSEGTDPDSDAGSLAVQGGCPTVHADNAEIVRLATMVNKLQGRVDALQPLIDDVDDLVASWHSKPEYDRHPNKLGVTIKTNAGTIYKIFDAMHGKGKADDEAAR